MTPFLVEGTRGERIGEIPPYVRTDAADSLSPRLFLHKRQSFRMERSGMRNLPPISLYVMKRSEMRNPEGLDAVNLFITGCLFFVT